MEELFKLENFNIIEDEENYYFFRALNKEDSKDLQDGTILDENGSFIRIRTDRERYEEDPEKGKPKYKQDDEISLEQAHDHIKMHYRKDTNCISLSSNANVLLDYGRRNYNDEYVMIKVPKKEMGQRVKFAGQYMLEEIEKKVNEFISLLDENDEKQKEILEKIKKIEAAKDESEIKEIIKTTFKSTNPINKSKSMLKPGIKYRAPHSRISSYKALSDEQNLLKNKIIAKLTLLERKANMESIIPYVSNNKVAESIGNAFSSIEQIHYGDIAGEQIQNVPSIVMDMFALIQQIQDKSIENIEEIKRELITFVENGLQFEIPEESVFLRDDKVKDNITIEEMYELTDGKVEFGMANSIVKNMFYLSRSQARAREVAKYLNQITENNPKYRKIIEYIANNGFRIEPEAITRQSNKGYRLSESVSLDLKESEKQLVEAIRNLSTEEQIEILEKGGLSNTRNIITETFSRVQRDEKISREEYYAGAIIDLYNWKNIGIEEFTIEQKNDLLKKLQEKDCVQIYKKLQDAGISPNDIPLYLINIASKEQFSNILTADNYIELIRQNKENLSQELSIPQIETFLGYYNIEGTEIVLRDYQRNAVEKTDEIFEEKRFASVVLPTGAGKTFVALTELLEHKNESILYLAPQNEILEQTKDRIIEYIHGKQGTLGKTKDEIIAEVFPNIKFETYPGLLAHRGKEVIKDKYDFIVLDELHRTGAKEWEAKLDELLENQEESTKVLGITATPIRDMDDRNMADEMALKLGYTKEEVQRREHIAMDMDLVDAIKLGLVVNPKIVSCEYTLKTDGSMENLLEKINSIEDEEIKKEKIEQYEKLRRKLDSAEGIPEIIKQNIKAGGKYIVFIPITDKGEILEDEDGNEIGKKTGIDKIQEYEQKIREYLKDSGLNPKCYSMLGAYSDKKNEEQLNSFENDDSEDAKFMLVMNKANEGLHIKGIDGIVWFRALDENSKILYLQQLGRAIYSEDPNNPTPDEKRPVVIDLANNTLNVNIDKEIKNNTRRSDLELLSLVVDWVKLHNGLPNIDSTNKIEQRYAATLYRIQNEYMKYTKGFEQFPNLDEEKKDEIDEILNKGAEIDLWDIELLPNIIQKANKLLEVNDFEVTGVMRDFVTINNEVDEKLEKNTVDIFIEKLEKLQEIGVDVSKIKRRDTIKSLVEKLGVSKEKLKEIELNEDDNIGRSKMRIIQAYRGKGECIPPTKEQVQRLLELGICLERQEVNIIDEFIDKLEKLQEIGVDVSKITSIDTIETLAKKSGVSKEMLKKIGLNVDDKIGHKKTDISQLYRGRGSGIPPTQDQVKRLLKLGISLEKLNTIDVFINKLERLQEIGVDVSKIKKGDTIKSLVERSGVRKKRLNEIGLNENEKIGKSQSNIVSNYRGRNRGIPPTQEQVQRLLELGIRLEKQEINTIDIFIEKIEKLQEIGVDVSKIKKGDTIKSLVERSGVSKKRLNEIGLNENEKIGKSQSNIVSNYRGRNRGIPPTEEQVQRLLELGIRLEKQEINTIDIFIEKIEKLQEIGVDVSKVTARDTIKSLVEKSGVSKEKLKEIGLDEDDKIGQNKSRISQAYRGKGGRSTPPTEEQVQRLLELGIVLDKKERTSKEIAEASISSIKDMELADEEDKALQQLAEHTKEGGINVDEQS